MAVPYLLKYTELLNCDYDIIYWNRYGVIENSNAAEQYVLEYQLPKGSTKLRKLIGYLKFKALAEKILCENDYEKLILLSGNVAVLLKNVLLAKYRGRYIIDIRDYFMENNKLYFNAENTLIDNSALAVISSAAYKNFLPEHDYVLAHNSPILTENQIRSFRAKKDSQRANRNEDPVVLSFIGGVRFFEQDKKVLSYFANDERFFLRYIGAGADLLRKHCEKNDIKNVYLHDRFPPEQTLGFYETTDVILNLYGNGTPLLDYALSNKLYYAATLGLPILVCPGTHMEEVAVGNGFGFMFDLNDPIAKDMLYLYYRKIDWENFYKHCDEFLTKVHQDEEEFLARTSRFLN